MRLWRLSTRRYAEAMDGGYGLLFHGRWNTVGRPVTYAATSPSLCVLEKLVHIEDPTLLPELAMVLYAAPDDLPVESRALDDLPADWRERETLTQELGNAWLARLDSPLLFVPSAVVPIGDAPDRNVLINHRHAGAAAIRIERVEAFTLDVRLFRS